MAFHRTKIMAVESGSILLTRSKPHCSRGSIPSSMFLLVLLGLLHTSGSVVNLAGLGPTPVTSPPFRWTFNILTDQHTLHARSMPRQQPSVASRMTSADAASSPLGHGMPPMLGGSLSMIVQGLVPPRSLRIGPPLVRCRRSSRSPSDPMSNTTDLFELCAKGRTDRLRELLQGGADPFAVDECGRTILHQVPVVEHFLALFPLRYKIVHNLALLQNIAFALAHCRKSIKYALLKR